MNERTSFTRLGHEQKVRTILFGVVLLIIFAISLNCMNSTIENYQLIPKSDDVTVDGTDMTPFVDLVITGTNSLIDLILTVGYYFVTIGITLAALLIIRGKLNRSSETVDKNEIDISFFIFALMTVCYTIAGMILSYKYVIITFLIHLVSIVTLVYTLYIRRLKSIYKDANNANKVEIEIITDGTLGNNGDKPENL